MILILIRTEMASALGTPFSFQKKKAGRKYMKSKALTIALSIFTTLMTSPLVYGYCRECSNFQGGYSYYGDQRPMQGREDNQGEYYQDGRRYYPQRRGSYQGERDSFRQDDRYDDQDRKSYPAGRGSLRQDERSDRQYQREAEDRMERNDRDTSDNYDPQESYSYRQRDGQGSESDRKIYEKIRDLLKGGTFSKSYDNVNFNVNNGHVIVTGTIQKESDRKDFVKKVENIDGVKDVENRIQVIEKDKSDVSDAKIEEKIKDILKGGMFSKAYQNVNAEVMNRNVVLTGSVSTEDDKRDLAKKIEKIDGVKVVENRIVVR